MHYQYLQGSELMKLSELIPQVEFGFTYNKFTFPLTFVWGILMIPIVYYPDLHSLFWIMLIPLGMLYMPIHDKPTTNYSECE